MLHEVLEVLAIRADGCYVDCTFGRGGHSQGILGRLDERGQLLAMDRDLDVFQSDRARALLEDPRFRLEHRPFGELGQVVNALNWRGRVAGILMDLGVSSPQLDTASRGFSFLRDGPLDMRMNQTEGMTAADWLRVVSEAELAQVLRDFGEERYARRIARRIVERRRIEALESTAQLASLIASAVPTHEKGKHPATRSFQAIRMRINDELGQLVAALESAVDTLSEGGRLVVIAFHSIEDRIVKRFMRDMCRGSDLSSMPYPQPTASATPKLRKLGRAARPSVSEVKSNPRARSAILRVCERVAL